jgi:hypothetical protein
MVFLVGETWARYQLERLRNEKPNVRMGDDDSVGVRVTVQLSPA